MKNRYSREAFYKIIFILFICSVSLFCLCIPAKSLTDITCLINNKKITLEVADTDTKRQLGLMFRDSLDENQGMIFLFNKPREVSFWMKNVKIPLDMLFIYKNKVVKIYNMVPGCNQDPCDIYPSQSIVDSVIELKGGFCQKNNIKIGQTIKLNNSIKEKIK